MTWISLMVTGHLASPATPPATATWPDSPHAPARPAEEPHGEPHRERRVYAAKAPATRWSAHPAPRTPGRR